MMKDMLELFGRQFVTTPVGKHVNLKLKGEATYEGSYTKEVSRTVVEPARVYASSSDPTGYTAICTNGKCSIMGGDYVLNTGGSVFEVPIELLEVLVDTYRENNT